ncbi:MAG: acylphosphatase [Burkholderiales bacterium]
MNECVTRHLHIRGRVQGVGFRNYIEFKARQLGVRGWVRNRSDGSVEAVVSGEPSAVDAIIDCARRGPRAALVSDVGISPAEGDFPGFEVRATA